MAEVYPSDNALLNLTSESETGVEYIETGKAPYYLEFRKLCYRLLEATKRANDLRAFDEGGLDIGVKAGKFWDGTTLRTYAGSSSNTLADDKANIYVYLNAAGALVLNEYAAWPAVAVNHIRLAIVTTSGGDIASVTDARDHHMWFSPGSYLYEPEFYSDEVGSSVAIVGMHWDSASPGDNDELRMPFYGENDNDEKIEYARLVVKLADVSDGTEDGDVLLSVMIAGTLTSLGSVVCTSGTATLTNKSIDCDSNTVTNVGSVECENYDAANGGMMFTLKATVTSGVDVTIHNADAPFKYRIVDAWSVATSADGGTWKLTDGTNDISDSVTVTGTDKTIDRIGTLDDAYHEIAASGTLTVDADGANADCEVYIMCMRVA